MAFPESSTKARIGQSAYWVCFGANMVLLPLLVLGGVYLIATGSYGMGILLMLAILPVSIWFRVMMMRRCRDIGWPSFLPWIFIAGSFLIGFLTPFHMRSGETPGAGAIALPMLLSGCDFVFSIVIGCIGTKADTDYADVFGPDYGEPSYAARRSHIDAQAPSALAYRGQDAASDIDRYDEAIARALEAHKQRERLGEVVAASAGAAPAHIPGRSAATFGRRVI